MNKTPESEAPPKSNLIADAADCVHAAATTVLGALAAPFRWCLRVARGDAKFEKKLADIAAGKDESPSN